MTQRERERQSNFLEMLLTALKQWKHLWEEAGKTESGLDWAVDFPSWCGEKEEIIGIWAPDSLNSVLVPESLVFILSDGQWK